MMGEAEDKGIGLDPLRREALAWIGRLTSGRATAADAEALQRWRRRSPAHAAAFAEASRQWQDFGPAGRSLRGGGVALPGGLAATSAAGAQPLRRLASRRAVLAGGAAAAVAAYAMVQPPLDLWPSLAELRADYRTATGEQRRIALAGDVAVQLNTQTSLALRSAEGGAQRIELIAGEAAFATAQAASSLVVLAADGRAVASGARFEMRRRGPSVRVTCLDGNVRVEQRTDAAALGAGQQVRYDAGGLGRIEAVDPALASAWQRGALVFRSTPLAEVVEEINRYRPGRVILLNDALGRSPVNGRFRIDRIDEILLRMEQAFGARLRTLPGGIVLLS